MGVYSRERQCYKRRSTEVDAGEVHSRSLLSRLAGQRGNGQEDKWKMENVCGFHRSKQGPP